MKVRIEGALGGLSRFDSLKSNPLQVFVCVLASLALASAGGFRGGAGGGAGGNAWGNPAQFDYTVNHASGGAGHAYGAGGAGGGAYGGGSRGGAGWWND